MDSLTTHGFFGFSTKKLYLMAKSVKAIHFVINNECSPDSRIYLVKLFGKIRNIDETGSGVTDYHRNIMANFIINHYAEFNDLRLKMVKDKHGGITLATFD